MSYLRSLDLFKSCKSIIITCRNSASPANMYCCRVLNLLDFVRPVPISNFHLCSFRQVLSSALLLNFTLSSLILIITYIRSGKFLFLWRDLTSTLAYLSLWGLLASYCSSFGWKLHPKVTYDWKSKFDGALATGRRIFRYGLKKWRFFRYWAHFFAFMNLKSLQSTLFHLLSASKIHHGSFEARNTSSNLTSLNFSFKRCAEMLLTHHRLKEHFWSLNILSLHSTSTIESLSIAHLPAHLHTFILVHRPNSLLADDVSTPPTNLKHLQLHCTDS